MVRPFSVHVIFFFQMNYLLLQLWATIGSHVTFNRIPIRPQTTIFKPQWPLYIELKINIYFILFFLYTFRDLKLCSRDMKMILWIARYLKKKSWKKILDLSIAFNWARKISKYYWQRVKLTLFEKPKRVWEKNNENIASIYLHNILH